MYIYIYIYIYTLNHVENNHRDGPAGYTKKRKDNYMKIMQLKSYEHFNEVK